jgi:FkbM family methyltransferase
MLRQQQEAIRFIRSFPDRHMVAMQQGLEPFVNTDLAAHFFFDAVAGCLVEERVGKIGDGGKWICNAYELQRQKCIVYSVGVGNDWSFDRQMAEIFDCEVHMFDPGEKVLAANARIVQRAASYGKGTVTLHPWALGPVSDDPKKAMKLVIDDKPVEVRALDDMVSSLGHKRVDVLKLDIEGGEWSAMADILSKALLKELETKIILVEIHFFYGRTLKDLANLIERLDRAGFYLYRKEFNPFSVVSIGDTWNTGGRMCCAEYAFAREDLIDAVPATPLSNP